MARKKQQPEPEVEQGVLDPGFEQEKNPRVQKAAKAYYARMLERKTAGEDESEAHDKLLNTMMEEGIEHYVYQDIEVHVNTRKKVKVKIKGSEASDEDEE